MLCLARNENWGISATYANQPSKSGLQAHAGRASLRAAVLNGAMLPVPTMPDPISIAWTWLHPLGAGHSSRTRPILNIHFKTRSLVELRRLRERRTAHPWTRRRLHCEHQPPRRGCSAAPHRPAGGGGAIVTLPAGDTLEFRQTPVREPHRPRCLGSPQVFPPLTRRAACGPGRACLLDRGVCFFVPSSTAFRCA